MRYNDTSTTLPATQLVAGRFVPARTLPEVKKEPHWRNLECGPWSDLTFGRNVVPSRNAPDAVSGFNQQDYHWQGSVSV